MRYKLLLFFMFALIMSFSAQALVNVSTNLGAYVGDQPIHWGAAIDARAQNFTTLLPSPVCVEKARVDIFEQGTCVGNFKVHIFGDRTGLPNDTNIIVSTPPLNCDIGSSVVMYNVTFNRTELVSGRNYWLVMTGDWVSDSVNQIRWKQGGSLRVSAYNDSTTWTLGATPMVYDLYGDMGSCVTPSITNSSFNVTNYPDLISNSTAWNSNAYINVSKNLLTFTFTTSANTNASCSLHNLNYTSMVSKNSNYKLATTMTTSHSAVLYDNLSAYNSSTCAYCAYYDGSISSQSGCLKTMYSDIIPPTINRTSQIPPDVMIVNLMAQVFRLNFNLTDDFNISASLSLKSNYSDSDYGICTAGLCANTPVTIYPSLITGTNYSFSAGDNLIIPAVYNIDEAYMENTAHSALLTGNDIKIRFEDVSSVHRWGYFEMMIANTSVSSKNIYYCNSSYISGNLIADTNCALIYALSSAAPYNHTHTIYSSHKLIPFAISSGKISGIQVTNISYMVIRSSASPWNSYYITNNTNSIQTSNTNGVLWSSLSGTMDAHLHQFDENTYLNYCLNASDTWGNRAVKCYTDKFDIERFPPSSPDVYIPTSGLYRFSVPIQYTNSSVFFPADTQLVNYIISAYSNFSLVTDIVTLGPSSYIYAYVSAYYRFEEGSGNTAYDSSPNGLNLLNQAAYSYEASKGGNQTNIYSIRYDGTSGYSSRSHNNSLLLSNLSTISLWVKPNITFATGTYIFVSKSMGSGIQYMIGYNNANVLFQYRTASNTTQNVLSPVMLNNNSWNFIAVVINKTASASVNYSIYINNFPAYSINLSTGFYGSNTGDFNTGRAAFGATSYMKGNIDNVLVISKPLDNTEVSQLYNYGLSQYPMALNYTWNTSSVPDGIYNIRVTAMDNYTESSYGNSESFIIDRTSPLCSNIAIDTHDSGENATITADFSDAFNLSWIAFWGNFTDPSNITIESPSYSSSDIATLPLGNQSIIFGFNYSDLAGNYGNCSNITYAREVSSGKTEPIIASGVCPSELYSMILFIFIFIAAMIFILIGAFTSAWVIGIFGALILLIWSFSLVGCEPIIGIIVVVISILMMIGFALKAARG